MDQELKEKYEKTIEHSEKREVRALTVDFSPFGLALMRVNANIILLSFFLVILCSHFFSALHFYIILAGMVSQHIMYQRVSLFMCGCAYFLFLFSSSVWFLSFKVFTAFFRQLENFPLFFILNDSISPFLV